MKQVRRASSRAVRAAPKVSETYYPREWFAQRESAQLGMYENSHEWKDAVDAQGVGKPRTAEEQHALYWRMHDGMKKAEAEAAKAGMFHLPFLDWSLRGGCKPFLSATHAHKLYTVVHKQHVDELVRHTAGTPEEAAPLDTLIRVTAFDATRALVHFHASMHWNMLFCWKSVVPYGSVDVPVRLRRALWNYFPENGPEQLEKEFTEAAMEHVGNGFVWLVWNPATTKLEVKTTDRHMCPKVLGLFPLLGLNIWDTAIAPGYELNKQLYVKRFWNTVDWHWADKCYAIMQGVEKELALDTEGQADKNDVHIFPSMTTFAEEYRLSMIASGRRANDPLEQKRKEWESWKALRNREDPIVYGPGMEMASRADQESELLWKNAQSYHILATHAGFSSAYPTNYASWTQTSRWYEQLKAKANLKKEASFPPKSGILWPEEPGMHVLTMDAEEPDEVPEFEEGSPMPWKEMREKWFHSNTHTREFDFWRKRDNEANDKNHLYYGQVMSAG
eukprot:TRINITY_DN33324_c0_g1_i1.p1 TRINITY_DN33324_c0_g1~~TRINITY_DN33324_c0_g1_i1.p1  ORF type:complete len:504 (+),score=166.65 TRINITY_DN33324_c0_g1_i1:55-1566(+)